MAFHLHLIELMSDAVPARAVPAGFNNEPATSEQSHLCLKWYVEDGGSLRSRWAHAGD